MQVVMFTVFSVFCLMQMINSAPANNDRPNASSEYLAELAEFLEQRCPMLEEPANIFIDETQTGLMEPNEVHRCQYVAQCSIMGNPPEAKISWIQTTNTGKERIIHSSKERDVTIDYFTKEVNPMTQKPMVGAVHTYNRICLDSYMTKAPYTYNFKCRAESVCTKEVVESKPIKIKNTKSFKALSPSDDKRGPLITTATTNRVERTNSYVQLFCNAAGNPKPEIQWKVLDENNKLQPISEYYYIMEYENSVIVNTKLPRCNPQMTIVCKAINDYGTAMESLSVLSVE